MSQTNIFLHHLRLPEMRNAIATHLHVLTLLAEDDINLLALDAKMHEKQLLDSITSDIVNIRYHAYILFDDNEQLSGEIELRMSELFTIVHYRSNEIEKTKIVAYKKQCNGSNSHNQTSNHQSAPATILQFSSPPKT